MLPSRVISITVDRPWREVYDAIWRPQDFAKWASGLSAAGLTQDGDVWKGQGPEGAIAVRFTPHNAFGILDHAVDIGGAHVVHVPMRVLQNGTGADIQVTLFRQPGMSAARFEADAQWIERDLQALAKLVAP
jgi:hypothetical protein